ncbi:BTB/POZ domain-containing protein [Biomphalaria pfeifferi]|uniref:BTB/POZ domain-containing protein n=1 Tax=Biomphalaria pfeifferi TaxID=112525 RepID=A0AAD8BEJ1_BIOPF|nr:BTB/POZ domain-containing protein [Biomphalaria pfeifferi]
MEFSKFRDSGEFSDITIEVESTQFNLHKFPLCAKSEYFCEVAKLKSVGSSPSKVTLKDFPGGKETFAKISDFCYNMPLKLTKDNIVETRVAAGYLKMSGSGNLIEVSDKCLNEMLTSARLSRSDATITELLIHCTEVGDLADSEGVVDVCIESLVDCWTKKFPFLASNVFTRVPKSFEAKSAFRYIRDKTSGKQFDELDECAEKNLVTIKPEWMVKLLTKARNKGIQLQLLGSLVGRYISASILNEKFPNEENCTAPDVSSALSLDEDVQSDQLQCKAKTVKRNKKCTKEFDDAQVLDKIVLALPEQGYRIPSITIEWLSKVLRLDITRSCQCRDMLVRLAGELMYKLDPDYLYLISPAVLHDIVQSSNTEGKQTVQHNELTCKLVDSYMSHMNSKGVLTSDTFRLLVSATTKSPRTSHDSLFHMLQNVLQTEKDNLSSDQRKELTSLIDANLLSEACLQRALDEDILPPQAIATSALKLCSKLRAELLSYKYRTGEDSYRKYSTFSSAHSDTPSGNSETRLSSAFSTKDKTVDSGFIEASDASRSPAETLRTEGVDLTDHNIITEPLTAAHNVLVTARHKLSGFKPTITKYPSLDNLQYHYSGENDPEEDYEPIYERQFPSLESRLRYYRVWGFYPHGSLGYRNRGSYLPYSAFYNRF